MAKILWVIHGYPPQQNAGAEWMAKEINDYLETQGHEVRVSNNSNDLSWSDIVFTHLDLSQGVTEECQEKGVPCVNVIHHSWEIPHLRTKRDAIYCVYNSDWVKQDRNYPHESIVLRPPVNIDRFKDVQYNPGGYITLVNCNKDKGGLIFANMAKAMPDKKFLGVLGAHGPQFRGISHNLTYWDTQEDITKVFEQTSVLVVPSIYESYGRIAIEAAACGIPVIAADTPGLKESLAAAGVFVRRKDFPGWLGAIREAKPIPALKERAALLWEQSQKELQSLHQLILSICQ